MKKRNKQPYKEIIDLKAEQKEYVKLCNDESELYRTYSSWESHINDLLDKFNSQADLYNFKRFCINQDRVFSNAPVLFDTYVILIITLILDAFFPLITILGAVALLLYAIKLGISRHNTVIKESCFFKDIIEIIEKRENKN